MANQRILQVHAAACTPRARAPGGTLGAFAAERKPQLACAFGGVRFADTSGVTVSVHVPAQTGHRQRRSGKVAASARRGQAPAARSVTAERSAAGYEENRRPPRPTPSVDVWAGELPARVKADGGGSHVSFLITRTTRDTTTRDTTKEVAFAQSDP